MTDALDDRLDRDLAGELSAREQRELAQAALDDPELFDTLTAAALLKETARGLPQPRTRTRLIVIAGAAMAAAAVIGVLLIRRPQPTATDARPPQAAEVRAPASGDSTALATPPVFLTARFDRPADRSPSAFRSTDADSRLPKEAGAVGSVDGDTIEVDVGSLDGVAQGTTLRLFRQDAREPVATLVVTAVFRERSRGRVTSGAAQVGDRAEVSLADQVGALLQHADARAAAGDMTASRRLAELAVARAEARPAPPDVRRRALAALGTLERQAGALEEAARHLRLAVDEFDATPVASAAERVEVLTALGGVLIERREYVEAEPVLLAAQPAATGRTAVRIANDRAALAALRGDRVAAEALYRSAIELAGTVPDLESDRRAIRDNLEALRAPR